MVLETIVLPLHQTPITELELCTGFEPVILVLQTSALTNLANRALKLELTLRLELRTYALQVRRSTN